MPKPVSSLLSEVELKLLIEKDSVSSEEIAELTKKGWTVSQADDDDDDLDDDLDDDDEDDE